MGQANIKNEMNRQSLIFSKYILKPFKSHMTNMATFVALRQPVTIVVKDLTTPDNLTNDLFILKF